MRGTVRHPKRQGQPHDAPGGASLPARRAFLAAALPALVLGACGFRPLHAPEAARPAIAVDAIDGPAGFALRERLVERLGMAAVPEYRLAVALDLAPESAAITRDNITTRFVLIGTARYALTPEAGGAPVLEEAVTARTAYSAPASESAAVFAARAAALDAEERLARTLADRIALRLALLAG